ncbi:MAG: hypothetical protein DME26_16755 [Verrucomicrobia bacterium]|nr:MAG: hypothetical protein DME26_16755 [Verrucomicrobiota bacterium]
MASAIGYCVISSVAASANAEDKATVIVVVGAPGEEEYGKNFQKWAELWETAGRAADAKEIIIGLKNGGETNDLERLRQALHDEPKEIKTELWLVLIGHGTFDGKDAKFNLRGPDLSATNLAGWLQPFRRPVAVINCASASGAFLPPLSAEGRIVITATKSGHEINYARFGQYLSEAILDPQADLDKDGQTSLLEAFLSASHRVGEFYKAEGRLATEHALLDDNGDGLGTPADWFRGIRAVKKAAEGADPDGVRAHQFHLLRSDAERKMPATVRAKRDALELAVAKLRESKAQFSEDEYYRRLETFLIELAQLYQQSDGPR